MSVREPSGHGSNCAVKSLLPPPQHAEDGEVRGGPHEAISPCNPIVRSTAAPCGCAFMLGTVPIGGDGAAAA
jgi:hypothetical protein